MRKNKLALRVALSLAISLAHAPEALAQGQQPVSEIELDSGITLKDWLELPASKATPVRFATGIEAAQYIRRYGPYRELLAIVQQASQAESLDPSAVTRENASAKLVELRAARAALGDWPGLLMASVIAHGMAGDRKAALADLKSWLRTVPANEKGRADVVAVLAAAGSDPLAIDAYLASQQKGQEEIRRVMVRPALPVDIDPASWSVIEKSDAYRNMPKARSLTMSNTIKEVHLSQYSGEAAKTVRTLKTSTPVGERCVRSKTDTTSSPWSNDMSSPIAPTSAETYSCAGIAMLTSYGGTKHVLRKINKISGSLFPPVVGAQVETDYELAPSPAGGKGLRTVRKCRITERIEIGKTDRRFSGDAWKLDCTTASRLDGAEAWGETLAFKDLLLQDLGITLIELVGTRLNDDGTVPQPGYKTVYNAPSGGLSISYTFESFSFTASN